MISTSTIPSANDSPLTPLRFLQRSAEVYPEKEGCGFSSPEFNAARASLSTMSRR